MTMTFNALPSAGLIIDRRVRSKIPGTFKPVSVDLGRQIERQRQRESSGYLVRRSVLIGMQVLARDKSNISNMTIWRAVHQQLLYVPHSKRDIIVVFGLRGRREARKKSVSLKGIQQVIYTRDTHTSFERNRISGPLKTSVVSRRIHKVYFLLLTFLFLQMLFNFLCYFCEELNS